MKGGAGKAAIVALVIAASLLLEILTIFFLIPRPEILVAFDEAFAATRPDLVAEIAQLRPLDTPLLYQELPLATASSKFLEILAKLPRQPLAIAVSPLLARALIDGAARNGGRPPEHLVVMEAPEGFAPEGLVVIRSDPLPAFKMAGELLGGILADYRAGSTWSGKPAPAAEALFLFSPGDGRTSEAREAFTSGWNGRAAFAPLVVSLTPDDSDAAAAAKIRSFLAGDIKAFFVAAPGQGAGALSLAQEPGRMTGFASSSLSTTLSAWPDASFAIHPDEGGLVSALRSMYARGGSGEIKVHWVLEILPGAKILSARSLDLAERLKAIEKTP